MRSRFAYVAILALTFALLVPSTAVAAEKQISVDVAAARVAAENLLMSRGINPGDAVFQVGARNYAGPNCPGSGWNCTSAAIVIQIATGGALSSVNRVDGCDYMPNNLNPCTIMQDNAGGKNDARCVQRATNTEPTAPEQICTIIQTNTTGLNKAVVSQSIKQSQPNTVGSQSARQTATVSQSNDTGTNDSQVSQWIEQTQNSDKIDATLTQTQESHQRADVCQGADPCTGPSNGKNVSDVFQSNAQRLKARFGDNSTGTINQYQNTGADPTSIATVNQTSTNSTNDSRLTQSSREIATVLNGGKDKDEDNDQELGQSSPFAGMVNQQQGATGNPICDLSGLCGHVTQTGAGVQRGNERQDELQKLQGPPKAVQTQYGPEFCCATQNGSNPKNSNDVDQNKTQLHTSSFTEGTIMGHCESLPGCSVNQRLRQNGTTATNSCTFSTCNPTILCVQGTPPGRQAPEMQAVVNPPCATTNPPPPCTDCKAPINRLAPSPSDRRSTSV
ncbi:MAG: hypothetical protein M3082_14860 [Candidatus Dormibacteraeota bacterium]|nr:hypothetical protein [Candidatus Dormibacteraeota bacterium]